MIIIILKSLFENDKFFYLIYISYRIRLVLFKANYLSKEM